MRTDTDAEHEAISLRSVVLQVANASNLGLVILDACRNNPFAAKMQRSIRTRAVDRGLARTEPSDNVLVAYAAKDGTTANDGTGRNSPFTAALLKNLETPGLEITFVFRNVRDDVMAATKREQQPFVYGSLSKEAIYLRAAAVGSQPSAAPPANDESPAPKVAARSSSINAPASQSLGGTFTAGDMARVRAIAAQHKLLVPEFEMGRNNNGPPAARRFMGVWASKVGFGGNGRQGMLIVTDVDSDGRAAGYFAYGPPTPSSYEQTPAGVTPFVGKLTGDNLTYEYGNGVATVTLGPNGKMFLVQKRKDGKRPAITLAPVWQSLNQERAAGR